MSDETRQFSPFDDDDDRTGDRADDRTEVQQNHPDDETVLAPRPDATSVMPATQRGDWAAEGGAWAGRAEVKAPRPTREEWGTSVWDGSPTPPDEPRGRWWMPIVVGIVALVLLGALGYGIYLITSADTKTPASSPSAPTATKPAPDTTEPDAATQPTTTPPTTQTTTTQPADTEVTVPALMGLSQEDAQQALERRGLGYRVITRNQNAPAGTVIDSDPSEGQQVPPNTVVTLVIASQPETPPSTPAN